MALSALWVREVCRHSFNLFFIGHLNAEEKEENVPALQIQCPAKG
jgi:hypothetical protein